MLHIRNSLQKRKYLKNETVSEFLTLTIILRAFLHLDSVLICTERVIYIRNPRITKSRFVLLFFSSHTCTASYKMHTLSIVYYIIITSYTMTYRIIMQYTIVATLASLVSCPAPFHAHGEKGSSMGPMSPVQRSLYCAPIRCMK